MRTFALILVLSLALSAASASDAWSATPAAVDRLHGQLFFATNDMVPWVGKQGLGNAASLVASLPLPVMPGTIITSIQATEGGVFVLVNGAPTTYPTIGLARSGGVFQSVLTVKGSGLLSEVRSMAVEEETATIFFTAQASDSTWGVFSMDYSRENARVEPLHALPADVVSASGLELHESTLYFLLERTDGTKEVRSFDLGSFQESLVTFVFSKTSSMRVDQDGQLWIVEDRKNFYRCSLETSCLLESVQLRGSAGNVDDFVVVSDEEVVVANGKNVVSLKASVRGRDDPPVLQVLLSNDTSPTPTPTPTRTELPSIPANFTLASPLPSRSTNHSVPFPVPSAFSRSYTPIITASNTPGINGTEVNDSPRSPIISTEGWELIGVFIAILACSLAVCLFVCWKRTVRDEMAMSLRLPDSPDDFL